MHASNTDSPDTPDNPPFDPNTAGPDFADNFRHILRLIAEADDGGRLRAVADEIQALMPRIVALVEDAQTLSGLISTLNDALTRRVLEVAMAEDGTAPGARQWCWILLGSGGRQEQTLTSDQDNGIIFANQDTPEADEAMRARLLPLAKKINHTLDACGFPLCTGQVMAGNPEWCLSLHEWKRRFGDWIIEGAPQALLNASIFFDLRPLFGALHLAEALQDWLAHEASANQRFLFQMSQNALRRTVPLNFLQRIALEKNGPHAGKIDLKISAATLFVDAARIYGLACGARTCNTAERLRQAAARGMLHPGDVEEWIKAFYFIQALRLKYQERAFLSGQAMHNHLDPGTMGRGEKKMLLAALKQAQALQRRLGLDYPGSA